MNELGPGKFRTSADNRQEQTCYFTRNKSDSHFTSYTAKLVTPEKLLFSIVKVNSDFNLVNKSLEIELKNNSFLNDQHQRQSEKIKEKTLTMEKNQQNEIESQIQQALDPRFQSQPYPSENEEEEQEDLVFQSLRVSSESESEEKKTKNQNFLKQQQPEKSIVKRNRIRYTATGIKYSPTRVKSRNFLSNISYTGISKGIFTVNLLS